MLEFLVLYNYFVLYCKSSYLCRKLQRVAEVHSEHSEKHPDKKRKCQMMRQPFHPVFHMVVQREEVRRAQRSPYGREFDTYDTLYVELFISVIPELHIHPFYEYESCYVLYHRHHHCHHDEYYQHIHIYDACHHQLYQPRHLIHAPQPEPVQRKVRACQEPRVDPRSFRIFIRYETPEKELHAPPQTASNEKQKCKNQKIIHVKSLPSS